MFKESNNFKKFESKVWLSSPTMHGSEIEYVKEFKVDYKPPVAYMKSKKCVHSAFKSSGKNAFSPKHMDYMYRYAKTNGLTPAGNAFGTLVCSVLEGGRLTGFFEAWLPVE